MPDESWYREWRHKEREHEAQLAADAALARRAVVRRVLGETALLCGIVGFIWASWVR